MGQCGIQFSGGGILKNNEFVKQWRKSRGFTQDQLASFLDVSKSVVSKWERSERNPQASVILALLTAEAVEAPDEVLTSPDRFRCYLSSLSKNHS